MWTKKHHVFGEMFEERIGFAGKKPALIFIIGSAVLFRETAL